MKSQYTSFPAIFPDQESPKDEVEPNEQFGGIEVAVPMLSNSKPLVHSEQASSLPPSVAAMIARREPHWKTPHAQIRADRRGFSSRSLATGSSATPTVPVEADDEPSSSMTKGKSRALEATSRGGNSDPDIWHIGPAWLETSKYLATCARHVREGKGWTVKDIVHLHTLANDYGWEYLVLALKWASDDCEAFAAHSSLNAAMTARDADCSAQNVRRVDNATWRMRLAIVNRSLGRTVKPACAEEVLCIAEGTAAALDRGEKQELARRVLETISNRAKWLAHPDFTIPSWGLAPWFDELVYEEEVGEEGGVENTSEKDLGQSIADEFAQLRLDLSRQ